MKCKKKYSKPTYRSTVFVTRMKRNGRNEYDFNGMGGILLSATWGFEGY